jgi:hypothetical protein
MHVKPGLSVEEKNAGWGVFQNRAPRKLLGPTREKVTRNSRKLHDEELNNLYFPPGGQMKLDGMGGTCDIHGFGGEN